jgi:pimeloyl-ACP methyl ester carboxylesterase
MAEVSTTIESFDGVLLDATITRPSRESGATVVLVHGIAADKDQGGMFTELAGLLAEQGRRAVRFSFRGHGDSGGSSGSILIANEISDLCSVVRHCLSEGRRLSFVASSFGAVATLAALAPGRLPVERLVLWKPVLDLDGTFLHPSLPWGKSRFGVERIRQAWDRGFLALERLHLSPVLFDEMTHYDPATDLLALRSPWLIIHGSADSYVSFEVARSTADGAAYGSFHEISGADHRLERPSERSAALSATVAFLLAEDFQGN